MSQDTSSTSTSLASESTIAPGVPAVPAGEGDPSASGGLDIGAGNARTDMLQSVLGVVGAGLEAVISFEQQLTAPLGAIPYPALPALRVGDMVLGIPHPHLPIAPFPPFGPIARYLPLPHVGFIIPLPLGISGAATVIINGSPAARCGDMALCIPTCLGFMPITEVFLGSCNVWLEGQRAARFGDLTRHCSLLDAPMIFFAPGIGFLPGSGDVMIGGVPFPSLTDMAIGALFDVAFAGLRRGFRAFRRVTRAADNVARSADNVARSADNVARSADNVARPVVPSAGAVDNALPLFRGLRERLNKLFGRGVPPVSSGMGDAIDAALERSKTLRARYDDFINNKGWLSAEPGGGSYISRSKNKIVVDTNLSPGQQVMATAHELGHHSYTPRAPKPDGYITIDASGNPVPSGRDQFIRDYVNAQLLDEGAALFGEHEVYDELAQVMTPDELKALGPPGYGNSADVWNQHKGSGPPYSDAALLEMGNNVRHAQPSTQPAGTTYESMYQDIAGEWYDEYFAWMKGGSP